MNKNTLSAKFSWKEPEIKIEVKVKPHGRAKKLKYVGGNPIPSSSDTVLNAKKRFRQGRLSYKKLKQFLVIDMQETRFGLPEADEVQFTTSELDERKPDGPIAVDEKLDGWFEGEAHIHGPECSDHKED